MEDIALGYVALHHPNVIEVEKGKMKTKTE